METSPGITGGLLMRMPNSPALVADQRAQITLFAAVKQLGQVASGQNHAQDCPWTHLRPLTFSHALWQNWRTSQSSSISQSSTPKSVPIKGRGPGAALCHPMGYFL